MIDGEKLVLTKNGNKKAKDIKVGDILITKTFDKLPIGHFAEVLMWMGKNELTNYKNIESVVTDVISQPVEETIVLNNNSKIRFSTTGDILTIKNNIYKFIPAREIKVGSNVVTKDSILTIEDIETVNENRTVYDFFREPFGLVISEDILCYGSYSLTKTFLDNQ